MASSASSTFAAAQPVETRSILIDILTIRYHQVDAEIVNLQLYIQLL